MRGLAVVLGVLLAIAVFLACLSAALLWVSFDRAFYAAEFTALGVPADLMVDLPTLMGYTEVLLDYLRGEVPSPNVVATVRGRNGPLYGEREVHHLKDVRVLMALAFLVRNLSIVLVLALSAMLIVIRQIKEAARAYLYAAAGILAVLLALVVLVAVDFTHYFTVFHLIAFDNDLWLLDPATEYLIRMVPEPFFIAAARRIALLAVGKFVALGLAVLVAGSLHAHAVKRNSPNA
ncbi:MAG: hypothetical protein DDT36_00617 [Firmicutes bacterium]|nr:hypothetical protein [Bacillota bacterium]